jgi:hypothetical protein
MHHVIGRWHPVALSLRLQFRQSRFFVDSRASYAACSKKAGKFLFTYRDRA